MGVLAFDEAKRSLERAKLLAGGHLAGTTRVELAVLHLLALTTHEGEERYGSAHREKATQLVNERPDDPSAWVLRGAAEEPGVAWVGHSGGRSSLPYYQKALELDENHLGAHHFLTHTFENIGEYQNAYHHARKFLAGAPHVPHAHHMSAHILPRLGQWKQARISLRRAAALHEAWSRSVDAPAAEDWHFGHNAHLLAVVSLRLGDSVECERLLRRVFELEIYAPVLDVYRGRTAWPEYLLLRGRATEALAAAKELRKRGPEVARCAGGVLEAEALLALGRIGEAREARRTAQREYDALTAHGSPLPASCCAHLPYVLGNMLVLFDAALQIRTHAPEATKFVLQIADGIASVHHLDGWVHGLYRLERLRLLAARHGEEALAAAILGRIMRIDPEFARQRGG